MLAILRIKVDVASSKLHYELFNCYVAALGGREGTLICYDIVRRGPEERYICRYVIGE